ncbi:DUF3824 domain-containing protein [Nesterenkonia flava]|uniref:DUF3824 domain-containing protein n=1 Tax=Nesterenkonia flava TaxID=469799 RepID=A0ABU1FTK7_9MICC|nr:DUF3824 domain-containing protein [Nesterenkonia flava]MDR5711677.1 DUF3824 domain-containing protein [Nesterenkonia flava]
MSYGPPAGPPHQSPGPQGHSHPPASGHGQSSPPQYGGPSYGGPQYGPPSYGPSYGPSSHGPAPYGPPGGWQPQQPPQEPARGSGVLSVLLAVLGGLISLAGVAAFVVAGLNFFGLFGYNILGSNGTPGDDAITSTEVPGTLEFDLEAGEQVQFFAIYPSDLPSAFLAADERYVISPSGEQTQAGWGQVQNVSRDGYTARAVASFTAQESGTHTMEVPNVRPGNATDHPEDLFEGEDVVVAVYEGSGDFFEFFRGVGVAILAVFLGIVLLSAGIPLLALGLGLRIGFRGARRRRRRG